MLPEISELTPTPPFLASVIPVTMPPLPPAPPPPPVPQLPELQLEPLEVPVPPMFPFPLVPPIRPTLLVATFEFVDPPDAVVEPNAEEPPLFPTAPLVAAVAIPPAPTEIATLFPGVTDMELFAITAPPPPPAGQ